TCTLAFSCALSSAASTRGAAAKSATAPAPDATKFRRLILPFTLIPRSSQYSTVPARRSAPHYRAGHDIRSSFPIPGPIASALLYISDQRSPTALTRAAIVRSVNVRGWTRPLSTSCQVHGADTGAPGFGRTAYAAANVAL